MLIIDGHNLIPKIPGLSLEAMDDENQLIMLVNEYCGRTGKSAEVFFDKAAPGHTGSRRIGRINVSFVSAASSADSAIIQRVKRAGKAARNLVVVTSDHRIQVEVRSLGAEAIKSDDFARELVNPPAARQRKTRKAAIEKRLSPQEVENWLTLFTQNDKDKKVE